MPGHRVNHHEAEQADNHDEPLGLLLSQISSQQAFPDAADRASVLESAAAICEATSLAGEPLDRHELSLSPGVIRLATLHQPTRSGGGVRRPVTGFSQSSRRRMLATLGTLDLASVEGLPLLVTLTYPRLWRDVCPDGRVAKQHLDRFRRRWSRRWGPFRGIWKMEFQPRSRRPVEEKLAPHFHILAVVPALDPSAAIPTPTTLVALREWVSKTWWDVVDSGDDKHLAAGTQVVEAEGSTVGRIVGYFAGYTAGRPKDEQHVAPDDWPGLGRYWGVSGFDRIKVGVPLSDSDFFTLRRLLAEVMARRRGSIRRRLRNADDGLWISIDQAPELVARFAAWVMREREVERAAAAAVREGRKVPSPKPLRSLP